MNFIKLYKMQKDLDEAINVKHNTTYASTFSKRIMAFIVELGEFANETRCFKYWSNKPMSERDVVLEEYIDGIHFILSIGLAMECFIGYEYEPKTVSDDLTENFLKVYELASRLNEYTTLGQYIDLFENFLGLGKLLGFEYKDIEAAYLKKNKVNYQRQDNNY